VAARSASGRDAQAALAALKQAVESGLGEEEEMEALPAKISAWTQQSSVRAITGVAASPGLAIGHLFQFQVNKITVKDTPRDADTEKSAFKQALVNCARPTRRIAVTGFLGRENSGSFEALFARTQ
jgi:multiphosphoryl transfer protein